MAVTKTQRRKDASLLNRIDWNGENSTQNREKKIPLIPDGNSLEPRTREKKVENVPSITASLLFF